MKKYKKLRYSLQETQVNLSERTIDLSQNFKPTVGHRHMHVYLMT